MPLVNILTDEAIQDLIKIRKPIPEGLYPLTKRMVSRNRSNRTEFDVDCVTGERFVVMIRLNEINPLSFSVILGYRMPGLTTIFRLRRYNGRHSHSNPIEKSGEFRDYHKHTATERYQKLGGREEHFAEIDTRFHNMDEAIKCLLDDCGFARPDPPLPLFDPPEVLP
jgi:hypothetical protein